MTSPHDAERLARLRRQRDNAPRRYAEGQALAPIVNFQWIDVDFLLRQLDATQSALDESRRDYQKLVTGEVLAAAYARYAEDHRQLVDILYHEKNEAVAAAHARGVREGVEMAARVTPPPPE